MIFYFIIKEPIFANLQKKFHTLDFAMQAVIILLLLLPLINFQMLPERFESRLHLQLLLS